jgi:hypothetical protein
MTADTAIRTCIEKCSRTTDGRAHRYPELDCYRALLPTTTPTIARMTAAAARRVAEGVARAA